MGAKTMVKKKRPSFSFALLLACVAAYDFLAASLVVTSAVAQSPTLASSQPGSVPGNTVIRISGSSTMDTVNQVLKQRFEQQFPGTQVSVETGGAAKGLQAVLEGKADLAAIGRPLTEAETAQGLVAVPVGRDKIAIVIGSKNSFAKSLDIGQFAKIFRGEIKNWSEVGGKGAIRFIDRPDSNDTRQAFRTYPAFQAGKFKTGSNASKVSDDNPQAVIEKLGSNGISYLSANQVRNQPGVKTVLMHDTAPTNPKYPFSQSLFYVYKGVNANLAASAFLGYATASAGQEAVKQAGVMSAIAESDPKTANGKTPAAKGAKASSLNASAQKENLSNKAAANSSAASVSGADERDPDSALPSWLGWLLPLGVLAAMFWILSKKQNSHRPIQAYRDPNLDFPGGFDPLQSNSVMPAGGAALTDGAGAWDTPDDRSPNGTAPTEDDPSDWLTADHPDGGTHSDSGETERPFLARDRDFTKPESGIDRSLWGASENQATPANLFEKTPTDANLTDRAVGGGAGAVARSFLAGARTPSDAQTNSLESPAPLEDSLETSSDCAVGNSVVLTPRDAHWAYVCWTVPRSRKAEVQRQGGENLVLRLYDVTGLDLNAQTPEQYEQFDCDDLALSCDVPIAAADRTYVAEVGYLAGDGCWLSLARSIPVWVPAQKRMG